MSNFESSITFPAGQDHQSFPIARPLLEKLPLRFEANCGQFDREVKFAVRSANYNVLFSANEAIINLKGNYSARLSLKPEGGNSEPEISGINPLAAKSNYLRANDSVNNITNVPAYAAVKYKEVYPQIDLVYYGNPERLEYDFILAPGADPRQIRLAFEGAQSIRIDSRGDLIIDTPSGELRQSKPVIYQESDGRRKEIAGHYTVIQTTDLRLSTPLIGFDIGAYDVSLPLVIDPVLSYSTYLGGGSADEAEAIAVDAEGCAYIVGHTLSANFPTSNPVQPLFQGPASITDIFLAKLNAQGTDLVYSTYLGGSGADYGLAIAVGADGRVCITGYTSSPDFPTTEGAFRREPAGGDDAFVVKLNPEGTELVYSTYLGGAGFERGHAVAIDAAGNAYVAGRTTSIDFPITDGAFQQTLKGFEDAFVAKVDDSGSALVYSTYLGGNSDFDRANDIAVDTQGNAYVTGGTASIDFPVTEASFQRTFGGGSIFFGDAFVTKINPQGSALVYSTYLGGARGDEGRGIAVDSSGQTYVAGITQSDNFPTMRPLQPANAGDCSDAFSNCNDAFVAKIAPSGGALIYSTYLGGGSRSHTPFAAGDSASAIAVDAAGDAYVIGTTTSDDFPVIGATQGARAGNGDAFIARVSSNGDAISYSTYFGGPGDESASGLALDSAGNIYVAGIATSTGFPTTAGSFQPGFGGSFQSFAVARDGFVLRLSSDAPRITGAWVVRKKLLVAGENFEPGAELFLNGKKQKKTFNDAASPTAMLVAKKSGKKIARGQMVILVVKNPGGLSSEPFSFVRED